MIIFKREGGSQFSHEGFDVVTALPLPSGICFNTFNWFRFQYVKFAAPIFKTVQVFILQFHFFYTVNIPGMSL